MQHPGNFIVVEITPIGIKSLQWKFYIIWTVFNASFVPLVYFFYPETADRYVYCCPCFQGPR